MVRKWLEAAGIHREKEFNGGTGKIPASEMSGIRRRGQSRSTHDARRRIDRMTKEQVGRVICLIGEKANVVVRQADQRTGHRQKFASAHDLRRGCAQRLINLGVSAETLKVILRHSSFSTTEKFYGATRSAQSAAEEVTTKLQQTSANASFVGGLVGGTESPPHLTSSDLLKLKRLLDAI